jgi:hypothetical protein
VVQSRGHFNAETQRSLRIAEKNRESSDSFRAAFKNCVNLGSIQRIQGQTTFLAAKKTSCRLLPRWVT